MAIVAVQCPVARRPVARVADLEDRTLQVICPDYEEPTGICRLKAQAFDGGPLSQLLDRLAEETLDRRSITCDLQ